MTQCLSQSQGSLAVNISNVVFPVCFSTSLKAISWEGALNIIIMAAIHKKGLPFYRRMELTSLQGLKQRPIES